jgi:CheY-like chemotaxis protein/HPt (histidine-containing phosphotransfer) domain-containing protein
MEMQRSAGQGLLGIINDILDFSKIEAGQLDIESAPLSIRQLTQRCVDLVHDQARRKALTVTAVVAENVDKWVLGDAVRLQQILLNLLSNAVKFTPSGSVTLVAERVADATDAYRFAVSDTGIGISEKNLATLFQRFSQADSSTTRRFGGTGLGLAISNRLAGLMGGDIEVQSSPGHGSTFCFTVCLPAGSWAAPVTRPSRTSRASFRLLLAEDNSLNCQLISAMLEQAGHEVVTVNDGAEAVRIAVRSEFDAILMDIQMPEMDGYAATRAIRRDAEGATVPIIALTANALSGEAERCLAAGMDAHIAKPVNWPALLETLDRLVARNGRQNSSSPRPAPVSPAEPAAPVSFEGARLTELRRSIGDQNTMRLLKLFVVDARRRFASEPHSEEAPEMIRREAHALAGSAGMLGFEELTAACNALQSADFDAGQFVQCLDRCRRARDEALGMIAGMTVDDEFAGAA